LDVVPNSARDAEPLRIRAAWVAPVSDWMSIWLDKKDLAVHYGFLGDRIGGAR
jgi:hypothetical protein